MTVTYEVQLRRAQARLVIQQAEGALSNLSSYVSSIEAKKFMHLLEKDLDNIRSAVIALEPVSLNPMKEKIQAMRGDELPPVELNKIERVSRAVLNLINNILNFFKSDLEKEKPQHFEASERESVAKNIQVLVSSLEQLRDLYPEVTPQVESEESMKPK